MRKIRALFFLIILLYLFLLPVNAESFEAPDVPNSGSAYMPDTIDSFGEGLWYVIRSAISVIHPSIQQALTLCAAMMAIALISSLIHCVSSKAERTLQIATAAGIGVLLLQTTNAMVSLGTNTVTTISEYGKLLIPVLTTVLAAQGYFNTSTALYTGTTLFATVLTNVIVKLIIPLIYIFICLCITNSALGENLLKKMQDFTKWLITWTLKMILYIFTGYISITGVVSGSADASMVKATKLTISGAVPVVGSILSDASESLLVSAGVMKSTVGIYGVLAIMATFIYPFLRIGVQYLLLKLTAAACNVIGTQSVSDLLHGFATAMGFILAIVSSISLLLVIGVVCVMKGVT